MALRYHDWRADPDGWARALAVPREAVEIYLASDVIDLHVDTFIWARLFGYDVGRRHGEGPTRARILGQVDLPRLREAQVTGALWSITTNPWRTARGRAAAFARNEACLRSLLESFPDDVLWCANTRDYVHARSRGLHAAFLTVQGGNAFAAEAAANAALDDRLIAVTLVHLTSSALGGTSSPLRLLSRTRGLTPRGAAWIGKLNERRIFVDLAHIDRAGFLAAAAVHDRTRPLMVSHTGVCGAHRHWRNIDDDQLRAVANTGGVVGLIYEQSFLGPDRPNGASRIVDHIEHVINIAGEDVPALGSDWDGAIITPRDMPTCLELPRLVAYMLERRWSAQRIGKVLGGNFLGALARLRP